VSRKRKPSNKEGGFDFSKVAARITGTLLEDEVEKSYLAYSYMVIQSRAIPDVRDGLKPSQRRVLYGMHDGGFLAAKQHSKSAKVVGHVMGSFHPHGDSAIYETLVRMTQDFAMNVPFVDGHGNFGSQSGANAAASRYTESRLARSASLMLDDVNEDAVAMRPNYDGTTVEPEILPARFPNLLVNGASGIAVGMGTNIPSYNAGQVMDGVLHLLRSPDATDSEMLKLMPAPDFPTGGLLIGKDQIRQAFKTGEGKFRIRGRYRIEALDRGKHNIVFYELPYGISPERILNKYNELRVPEKGKFAGIAYGSNLTDRRNGLRLVFETKAGVNPETTVLELFALTELESTFGVNNIVIVGGEPRQLGVIEILKHFIEFRRETVLNRSIHRRTKREERLHLVKGLLTALADIDEVIRIVRAAENTAAASAGIQKRFKIDEAQAGYVLGISLGSLTRYDTIKLQDERDKLMREIKELTVIIERPKALDALLAEEFEQTKALIDAPRRSQLLAGSLDDFVKETKAAVQAAAGPEDSAGHVIEDKPCVLSLTAKGALIRTDDIPKKPMRGSITSNLRDRFVMVTSQGRAFRVDTVFVGETEVKADSLLHKSLHPNEHIIAIAPENLGEGKVGGIAIGTRKGNVKICAPQWPVRSDEFDVIRLEDGDQVVSATWIDDIDKYDLAFIRSSSAMLTFPADKVRPQGLTGGGVAGIAVKEGDEVIAFDVIYRDRRDEYVVVETTGMKTKATPFTADLYPAKGRGTGGYTSYAFTKGEDILTHAGIARSGAVFDEKGRALALPPLVLKRVASGTPV
jgi:DNA gyrase subunit A